MSSPRCPKDRLRHVRPAGDPVDRDDFDDVQRIVLHGTRWGAARHLMLSFGDGSPLHFLHGLLDRITPAKGHAPAQQVSFGFTRRGLERASVPDPVLSIFALKAPAYWAGAALRAARHLGMSDCNAPEFWDAHFAGATLDAVVSVHGNDGAELERTVEEIRTRAMQNGLAWSRLPPAAAMEVPAKLLRDPWARARSQWVHFGFRDGLSRIGIRGWSRQEQLERCLPTSRHQPGEFVLGYLQDCGADPWVAGPRQHIWPEPMRAFFHNGSFGVLQQIEQDVQAFEQFVAKMVEQTRLSAREIRGKLCGRYPDGQPLAVAGGVDPHDDFDYTADPDGLGCPFGSHVRRMNPRVPRPGDAASAEAPLDPPAPGNRPAHFSRSRPLLRRGLPYGRPLAPGDARGDGEQRGLIGQFFCASIEDQYEHLLGEWAERVPLGSADQGGARDPFIGAHEARDGPFDIPQPSGQPALRLVGLASFTRTIGVAYLFYPSLTTLGCIAESSLWGLDDEENDAEDDE